LIYCTVD